MSWCDQILGTDPCVEADYHRYYELLPRAAALPTEQIARGWRIASTAPFRDETPGEWVFREAPLALAQADPARALDLVLMIIEGEPDDRLVAFLAHEKFLAHVLRHLEPDMLTRLARAALRWPRLRLLMGLMENDVHHFSLPAEVRQRLERLMTVGSEFPWCERDLSPEEISRCAALDAVAYAQRWTACMGRSALDKAMDAENETLVEAAYLLAARDQAKLVAIAAQIARIETSNNLLSYLIAGILEDALPIAEGPVLDGLIAEIERSEVFADLVSATRFDTLPAPVPQRIEAALRAKFAMREERNI